MEQGMLGVEWVWDVAMFGTGRGMGLGCGMGLGRDVGRVWDKM